MSKCEMLVDKCQEYREALEKIANPISYLQREAKESGYILNGQKAYELSNDANWLKNIAIEALKE
jgi:hypothetical protein